MRDTTSSTSTASLLARIDELFAPTDEPQETRPPPKPDPTDPLGLAAQFDRIRANINKVSGAKRTYTTRNDRMEELRATLVQHRQARGKSHADIAAHVGVTRQTVHRWETPEGFRLVRLAQVIDWAAYLGVGVEF